MKWVLMLFPPFADFVDVLADNAALAARDEQFMKAEVSYTTVKSNGHGTHFLTCALECFELTVASPDLNVLEMRPPLMDLSGRTKYPILVSVCAQYSSDNKSVRADAHPI